MALADDDEDDEPNAKRPRLDDGSLQAEDTWARDSEMASCSPMSGEAETCCFLGEGAREVSLLVCS